MLISIFLGTLLFTVAHFLPNYKNRILNGNNVRDPCCPGRTWGRVGHSGPHSTSLNNFGRDFQKYGHKFTEQLCLADSDSDGLPNGQELGLNTTKHNLQTLCQFVASYQFNSRLISFLEKRSLLGRPIGHPGICDQRSCPPHLRYRCGQC